MKVKEIIKKNKKTVIAVSTGLVLFAFFMLIAAYSGSRYGLVDKSRVSNNVSKVKDDTSNDETEKNIDFEVDKIQGDIFVSSLYEVEDPTISLFQSGFDQYHSKVRQYKDKTFISSTDSSYLRLYMFDGDLSSSIFKQNLEGSPCSVIFEVIDNYLYVTCQNSGDEDLHIINIDTMEEVRNRDLSKHLFRYTNIELSSYDNELWISGWYGASYYNFEKDTFEMTYFEFNHDEDPGTIELFSNDSGLYAIAGYNNTNDVEALYKWTGSSWKLILDAVREKVSDAELISIDYVYSQEDQVVAILQELSSDGDYTSKHYKYDGNDWVLIDSDINKAAYEYAHDFNLLNLQEYGLSYNEEQETLYYGENSLEFPTVYAYVWGRIEDKIYVLQDDGLYEIMSNKIGFNQVYKSNEQIYCNSDVSSSFIKDGELSLICIPQCHEYCEAEYVEVFTWDEKEQSMTISNSLESTLDNDWNRFLPTNESLSVNLDNNTVEIYLNEVLYFTIPL